jgi:hypothetical protein
MCMAIYVALMALLWIYSDDMLEQYALSTSSGTNEWTVVALGWEILPAIWPVVLLIVVASSAGTFYVSRRLNK